MKEKPSEWVAIADLMSGVMAVVMLLLVVSVLQKSIAETQQHLEKSSGYEAQRKAVLSVMQGIRANLEQQGAASMVSFDLGALKMTLPDRLFSRSSACIPLQERNRFAAISLSIQELLEKNPDITIYVDGHTDNVAVSNPVTDFQKFCTVYDDNYTLSAARAREVRKLVAGSLSHHLSRRVIVAGYGDSRPLPGVSPDSAANRRVEIRLSVEKSDGA